MGKLRLLLFLVAIFVIYVQGYDIDFILQKIPENERRDFLKHHINLGYELSKVDISRNKKIPQDFKELPFEFSIALYEKFRKDHNVDYNKLSTRENIICFPNGECIDIDDPGVHPYI